MEFFKSKKFDIIAKLIAVVLGVATAIYAIVFYFTDCFGTDKTRNFNLYFAIVTIAILVTIGYFLFHFIKKKEFNYPRMFVILGICWGITFQLVMPPCSGPDEASHIINAFHASNTYLGLKDQDLGEKDWISGTSYFYIRTEDYIELLNNEFSYPSAYYIITGGNIVHCKDASLMKCYVYPANFYRYIFSGLGIALGRLLGLGFIGVLMLGRLMNTLVFVLVGWLTMKLLPLGKLQMMSFLLLPSVIELCNCYSYDNFSILFSMLLLALCLYYSKPEVELRLIDLVALVLCLAMVLPNKYVYATFVVWVFMIPFKKWKNWVLQKHGVKGLIGIGAFGVLTVLIGIYIVWKKLFHMVYELVFKHESGQTIEQIAGQESYSLSYILAHPFKTIAFVFSGFASDFWYNLKHVIGSELGDVHLNAPIALGYTLVLLAIVILGVVLTWKGKHATKKQIIIAVIGCILCLGAIVIGCLIRFTPVDSTTRVQISWRYLVPLYMALVVICGTDEEETRPAMALLYGQNITLAFVAISLLDYLLG